MAGGLQRAEDQVREGLLMKLRAKGFRDWLRGIKESAVWILESVWDWVRNPPSR